MSPTLVSFCFLLQCHPALVLRCPLPPQLNPNGNFLGVYWGLGLSGQGQQCSYW